MGKALDQVTHNSATDGLSSDTKVFAPSCRKGIGTQPHYGKQNNKKTYRHILTKIFSHLFFLKFVFFYYFVYL